MIAQRSDTATGHVCIQCKQAVIKPFGSRPDETYLVCQDCVDRHPCVVKPVEAAPDLSDSFWQIMLSEEKK